MTKQSRALLNSTASILNRHLQQKTAFGAILEDRGETARDALEVINEVLGANAEGGRLICATEIDGTLIGFVSRVDVDAPDIKPSETVELPTRPLTS
jgi:hypothetical protein